MKRIPVICALLCLLGLVCFPDAALAAASEAVLLWWSRVLPSLLPYLILTAMIVRMADREGRGRFGISRLSWMALLLGAAGGYPIGARVIGEAQKTMKLSKARSDRLTACCNLMNPGFVVSVTAVGIFHSPRAAVPLAIALYSVVLAAFVLLARGREEEPLLHRAEPFSAELFADAVRSGIASILQILACILLCAVLLAVIGELRLPWLIGRVLRCREETVIAVLSGLLEMTCGIQAVAELPIPAPMRLALACFFLQFGGLSVFLQTVTAVKLHRPVRYLLQKGSMALVSAVLCYVLAQWFFQKTGAVFAPSPEKTVPAVTTLSVVFSAGVGVFLLFLIAVLQSRPKRRIK